MVQRLFFLTVALFSVFISVPRNGFTQTESDLIKKLNFDPVLISEIRNLTKAEIKQLPSVDQETGDLLLDDKYDGLYAETTEEKAVKTVKMLKSKFREKGYLIFVSEDNELKPNVAVIKGTDDLDILRYRRTDGINYGLENIDIIKKIAEWNSSYGLIVIGCSRDWLHVEFNKMPSDLDSFAREVYEFCPDSVDQGVGSIEALKKAIIEIKGVWLWWD